MSVRPSDVVDLVRRDLFPGWQAERDKLDRIDKWYRWDAEDVKVPQGATPELKMLVQLAKTPYLALVVSTVAQAMFVDGYRSPQARDDATPWNTWQRNNQDSRQVATHRAALAYGYSFETVLPGTLDGEATSVIRGVSPRRMYAVYAEPESDDWPMYALHVIPQGREAYALRMIDETDVHYLSCDASGGGVTYIEQRSHGSGVTPVVRFAGRMDLEGRTPGEVEPFVSVAARVNKTTYDRLMVQHFNSWKVRTVAGMTQPEADAAADRKKLQLRQDDILIAEDPDTKFGTLDGTPLDGFIAATSSDVESLAVVSQTPTYALTGDLINLSADAIAEARGQLAQKIHEYKVTLGASHDQKLRLAAFQQGDASAAGDYLSHVTWQDMETRSLSQAADALGKLAQMLGVPVEALWARIPGVTQLDVDDWKQMAREQGAFAQLQRYLDGADSGLVDGGDA